MDATLTPTGLPGGPAARNGGEDARGDRRLGRVFRYAEQLSNVRVVGLDQPQEIAPVAVIAHGLGKTADLVLADVTHAIRNLFQTGNFEPLPRFEHVHEGARFQERLVRARVEPGRASSEDLDGEAAGFEIATIEIGDLQLAPRRRLERF